MLRDPSIVFNSPTYRASFLNGVFVRKQRGFSSPRTIVVLIVLFALLFVPLWWFNKIDMNTKERQAAARVLEKAEAAKLEVTPPKLPIKYNPHGLTWGFMTKPTEMPEGMSEDMVLSGCHGEPKQGLDLPHSGSCNPYKGDTSCRVSLPVLCIKRWRSAADSGGVGEQITLATGIDERVKSEIASTRLVVGFALDSLADANALCEKEWGAGWRMASFHDGGWEGVVAKKGARLYMSQRHWVNIEDQKGNCWDLAN